MALPLLSPSSPWRSLERRFVPATDYGEHAHDVATLTLTLAGEYREDFEETRHVCAPFELQLKPRAVPHTTRAEHGARLFVVHLHADLLERSALAALSGPQRWPASSVSALALACRANCGDTGTLLRELLARLGQGSRDQRSAAPEWAASAARRLRDELTTPPRLADLAREADVHPVYFARVFRRSFGRSVDGWIRGARIDRAVRALLASEADIAGLALELGYYDQSHLGRDFRRETGWSPARFRAAVRALGQSGPRDEFRSS